MNITSLHCRFADPEEHPDKSDTAQWYKLKVFAITDSLATVITLPGVTDEEYENIDDAVRAAHELKRKLTSFAPEKLEIRIQVFVHHKLLIDINDRTKNTHPNNQNNSTCA